MPEANRPDLAAALAPLIRSLMAAERPILERHGLTMWGYSVLLGLEEEPVYTQAALAKATGADKTRIIGVLDDLQQRGLVHREPDAGDRRVHLVSLTPEGRAVRDRTQREIQQQEEEHLLSRLSTADRRIFLRALQTLTAAVTDPN